MSVEKKIEQEQQRLHDEIFPDAAQIRENSTQEDNPYQDELDALDIPIVKDYPYKNTMIINK